MILIFSSIDDQSTSDVIDWLNYYKAPFIRVNTDVGRIIQNYLMSLRDYRLSQTSPIQQ